MNGILYDSRTPVKPTRRFGAGITPRTMVFIPSDEDLSWAAAEFDADGYNRYLDELALESARQARLERGPIL
jgi:hypothetical protein